MAEKIEFKFTADDSALVKAFTDINNRLARIEKSAKVTDKSIENALNTKGGNVTGELNKVDTALNRTATNADRTAKGMDRVKKSTAATGKASRGLARSASLASRSLASTTKGASAFAKGLGGASKGLGALGLGLAATPFGLFAAGASLAIAGLSAFTAAQEKARAENIRLKKEISEGLSAIATAGLEEQVTLRENELIVLKQTGASLDEIAAKEKEVIAARRESLAATFDGTTDQINKLALDLEIVDKALQRTFDKFGTGLKEIDVRTTSTEAIRERTKNLQTLERGEGTVAELIAKRVKIEAEIAKIKVDDQKTNQAINKLKTEELALDKRREEEAKKRAAERRRRANFLADLEAKLIQDQEQREIALEGRRVAKLRDQVKENVRSRTKQNELFAKIEEQSQLKIEAIRKKFDDRRKKQIEELATTQVDAITAALGGGGDAVTQAFQQAIEQQELALETGTDLLQSELQLRQQLERQALLDRGATEEEITNLEAKQQEERLKLELETQKKKLQFQLQYAKFRDEAEKQSITNQIATIESKIQGLGATASATEPGEGILAKTLGVTDSEASAISDAVGQAVNSVQGAITEAINAYQSEIDFRSSRIGELTAQLQAEVALNNEGKASNIRAVREQLAEQERARADALKKQQQAQRVQVALDTASQASSLITASANIFKALSPIQPFGVPLAIGLISTMLGAFVAGKVQAFNATKFAEGGMLEGPSHAQGGIAVGNTGQEVEGGEWVTDKKRSKQQLKFFKALKKGNYDGIDLHSTLNAAKKGRLNDINLLVANTQAREDMLANRAIAQQTATLEALLKRIANKPTITGLGDGRLVEIDGNTKRITKFK